jgi:ERCC4-related helicase
MSVDWREVAERLRSYARECGEEKLDAGQRASLVAIAARMDNGYRFTLLADEVGMGKTRIAAALIAAVRDVGGRTAVVMPGGLADQWQSELNAFDRTIPRAPLIRSYKGLIDHVRTTVSEKVRVNGSESRTPENPWLAEPVVLISHSFANMQFPFREGAGLHWRRELLPAVERAWAGGTRQIRERGWKEGVEATHHLAACIARTMRAENIALDAARWEQRWMEAAEYRTAILPLIGYALGRFDLVVVDEAHKSRGIDSSLSRILGPVTWKDENAFCLGLTATPVEIDAGQWINTINRLAGQNDGVTIDYPKAEIEAAVSSYVSVVEDLRTGVPDEGMATRFESVADRMRRALCPYVLRRDKGDDPVYRDFMNAFGDYRRCVPIRVGEPGSARSAGIGRSGGAVSRDWLRRIAAAEVLSLIPASSPSEKRLRIAIGRGLALGPVVEAEADEDGPDGPLDAVTTGSAAHWLNILRRDPDPSLHAHPSLRAAVNLIESIACPQDGAEPRKVLVFGTYTRSIQALVDVLNARRLLANRQSWHGQTLSPRLEAALDHEIALVPGAPSRQAILEELRRHSEIRERSVAAVLSTLRRSLDDVQLKDRFRHELHALLDNREQDHTSRLVQALEDFREDQGETWTDKAFVAAARRLFEAVENDDREKAGQDEEISLRPGIERILQDYSTRAGSFARELTGSTASGTRRVLQAAFNRHRSDPMVLVAQSRVGREGLNLHLECRDVVLFHLEWNPAILEQQIGRVDRKGSRWMRDTAAWVETGSVGRPPTINIYPIVLAGTYDERQWTVLQGRWRLLRAQLHGEVLQRHAADAPETEAVIRIRSAAPSFSPAGGDRQIRTSLS